MEKPKIIGLPGDKRENAACACYRVKWPLDALARQGLAHIYIPPLENGNRIVAMDPDGKKNPMQPRLVNNYDMIVLQRQPDADVTRLIRTCKNAGIKVVFDIDDDALHIPPENPNYMVWGRDSRKVQQMVRAYRKVGKEPPAIRNMTPQQAAENAKMLFRGILDNIRLADLVTTTTPVLRDVYQKYNSNIVVLPNQMDRGGWENLKPVEHERLWIGWAGGWTHIHDLEIVARPMGEILRRYDHVDLCLIGWGQAKELVFSDISPERVLTFPWSDDVYGYRNNLASMDIILAPSYDNLFNAGKSDIRVMEAWIGAKAPVVASPTTYGETVRQAGGGLVAKNTKDWIASLSKLIEKQALRRAMGDAGYLYVRDYRTYDMCAEKWMKAYNGLWE
ncbi:glycosyltransferase [Patescibacteria group bacterium]|nr:glycosyltransferase [Patescibacteria group bacterium]